MPRIKKSKDYGMFHLMDENRDQSKYHSHTANLLKSMEVVGNVTDLIPIVVKPKDKKYADKEYPEGKYPIFNGQFRFVSIKLKNDWIYYVIDEQDKLKAEHLHWINVSKSWTYDDYMNYYCKLGFKEYAVYAGFKKRSGWSHNSVMTLLAGNTKGIASAFKAGTFVMLRSVSEANAIIEMINEFSTIFKYYKQRGFIVAMLRIIENVPDYNHDRMMQKMQYLSERLVRCPDTESYIRLLEKLYNFKSTGAYVRFI